MIYFYEVLKVIFALMFVLQIVPVLIWLERKICAWVQARVGPNRVGPFGLLQPLADAVKLIFKEDIIPLHVDKFLFVLAPLIAMVFPILLFAFLPFGPDIILDGYVLKLQIADFGYSVLLFMAVLSIAVYSVSFGGWASNNKYSLIGGLRAASQLVSYELIFGLSFLYVLIKWNTASFREIVLKQIESGWTITQDFPIAVIFLVLFIVAALAENKRLPFDLPEAESELVAGYHTEYSSMKFALFFMGEYVAITMMSCCIAIVFFGGYHLPGVVESSGGLLNAFLGFIVFISKVFIIIFGYMLTRWTLPRFRYDLLMKLSWHYLLPIALLLVLIKAII